MFSTFDITFFLCLKGGGDDEFSLRLVVLLLNGLYSVSVLSGDCELSYPISTLPEHLHSTSLSYAETTLNSKKLVSFPLIAHYLSAGPPLPPTPPFTGRPGHTHT